jgi:hypothetical protein
VLKRGQFVSVGSSSRCPSLLLLPQARSPILLTAHGPKPSEEQVRAYLAAGTGPLYLGPPLPAPRAFLITRGIQKKKDYPSPVGRGKYAPTDQITLSYLPRGVIAGSRRLQFYASDADRDTESCMRNCSWYPWYSISVSHQVYAHAVVSTNAVQINPSRGWHSWK